MKPNDKAIEAALLAAKTVLCNDEITIDSAIFAAVNAAYAAQFQSEEYAGLVKFIREFARKEQLKRYGVRNPLDDAADAIEALLAERDDFAEQLALRSESGMAKDMQEIMRINNKLVAERDALKAENDQHKSVYQKYVEAIDRMNGTPCEQVRHHYEVSELRSELALAVSERDALAARLAPVDDEALVEMAAVAIRRNKFERTGRLDCFDPSNLTPEELGEGRAAIAAIRPHIEAAERERCAKIAEGNYEKLEPASQNSEHYKNGRLAAAAAIRSGK